MNCEPQRPVAVDRQRGSGLSSDPCMCIASSGLGHVSRGIEAWAEDLGKALAARGTNVIVCKGAGKPSAAYEKVLPCWTRESSKTRALHRCLPSALAWRIGLGSGYAIEQSTFARKLMGVLQTAQVDILHVQDPLVALHVQRECTRRRLRTKTILAHGTEEPIEFQSKIEYLQHLAPFYLDDSRGQGAWKPSWTAIPNFIDTEMFSPSGTNLRHELNLPADAIVVLTVAAIKKHHKRIDYLIDEFSQLRARTDLPAYLVVAGGWETDTDQLIEYGRARLGDRVRFLVKFPRTRIADLYRTGDIFVLCSLKEMMPLALLEAMASGLPCLVHQHPVVAWMVGPGGQALRMDKSGELVKALQAFAESPCARRQLGQSARAYCIENFSRDRIVDRIVDYYQRVMTDNFQLSDFVGIRSL